MIASIPKNEHERLQALYRYNILDSKDEHAYDDITRLAAYIAQTPIALISFVDENRQWFKSRIGLDAVETSREFAFCAHAILTPDQPLIVPDAKADARFMNNPLVCEAPHIRFYAGEPLLTADHQPLGTLCVLDTEPRELNEMQIEALAALSRLVVTQLELRKLTNEQQGNIHRMAQHQQALETANQVLERQSLTDKLTGVGNRAGFDQRLHEEVARAKRYGSALSLLMLDVDHFKRYNDTHGHIAGDEALRGIAAALQEACRPIDYIARYGGEEFAVLLPTTGKPGSHAMAERLRQSVENSNLPHESLTVSIGASTLDPFSKEGREMLVLADKALYMAKHSGRNCVVLADSLQD